MTSAIEELQQTIAERDLDNTRRWFGPDRCDVIAPVVNEGGGAGDSVTLTPIMRGAECFIEEISGASAHTVIGGEAFVSSHRIQMKSAPETLAITSQYRLRVYPRGPFPERVFEKLVQAAESYSPLVILKATFVREGSQ